MHDRRLPPNLGKLNSHYGSRVLCAENFFTQILVDRVKESKLEYPFNQCYKNVYKFKGNSTIIDYIKSNQLLYSRVVCLELCFDLYYIENNQCNCNNASIGNVWDNCWIDKEQAATSSCTWQTKAKFYKDIITNMCDSYCPLECDSLTYTTESSALWYPEFDTHLLRFKVYLRSLQYTSIVQEEKTPIINLISNIGGILGLFIGVGFINLFEIIELSAEVFVILVKHRLPTISNSN